MTDLKTLQPLIIEQLKIVYPQFILQAEFQIQIGQRIALIGQSGGGKTTLLRTLAGLESAKHGKILLGKKDITQASPQNREVGLVFQDQILFTALNVLDNVTFGLRVRGVQKDERESLALEWLNRVGLTKKAKDSVQKLSGGEKQRIALIRALIWKPKFLLLDEPFSSLDQTLRNQLRKNLVELHTLWPAPLLLVTHDESDIQSIATHCLHLKWDGVQAVRTIAP